MAKSHLLAEHWIGLPQRLETITLSGGAVDQATMLVQHNSNSQFGGDCLNSPCNQSSLNQNQFTVDQNFTSTTSLSDLVEDSRSLFQGFGS